MNIYNIDINDSAGAPFHFNQYEGSHILIVNVASECGYTPQYAQLQELHEQYGEKIKVVGIPCNDFGGQEPGTEAEIVTFCQKNYGVTFPILEKVGIKQDTHPLYSYLTKKTENGVGDFDVKWNFHKFLIGPDGNVIKDFPSGTSPVSDDILSYIK